MLVTHNPLRAFRFTGLPLWASLLDENKLPSLSGSLSGPPLDAACSSLFCFFVPSACACSSEVAVTSCSPIPFVSLRGTCILNQRSLSVFENARQQPCKTEDPSEVTVIDTTVDFSGCPPVRMHKRSKGVPRSLDRHVCHSTSLPLCGRGVLPRALVQVPPL